MIEIEKTQGLEDLLKSELKEERVEMQESGDGFVHLSTRHASPLLRIKEVIAQIESDNPDLLQTSMSVVRKESEKRTDVLVKFVSKEAIFQEFKRKVHPVKCI